MIRKSFQPVESVPKVRQGFTLVELLVSIAVLAIIVATVSVMLGSASSLTTVNNKHADANDQSRGVFDRMANDFARMTKRPDVDYIFWKAAGNDAMYFYTEGSSYFDTSSITPPTGASYNSEKNQVSLVGYRVNNTSGSADYYQLERLGKALAWDGGAWNASTLQPYILTYLTYPPAGTDFASGTATDPAGVTYSAAYFNSTLAGAFSANSVGGPGQLPSTVGTMPGVSSTTFNDSTDFDYYSLGNQVFRFEYSFQLKDGTQSVIPVMAKATASNANGVRFSLLSASQPPMRSDDSADSSGNGTFAVGSRWYDTTNQIGYICLDATPNYAIWHEIGIQDISAIVVTIAVIDKQGLVFMQKSGKDMATLAAAFADAQGLTYSAIAQTWTTAITPPSPGAKSAVSTSTGLSQEMVSQIRIYQRVFYINNF